MTSYTEIHIKAWIASLSSLSGANDPKFELLSNTDNLRASRFRQDEDRLRFTLGRLLLVHALKECGHGETSPRLKIDAQGKPFLLDYPGLCFSITHTGNLVALALSPGYRVGIDIEQVRPTYENLLSHVFDPEDLRHFNALPTDVRAGAFFHAWTGKEAYLKAVGLGLAGGLRHVRVPMEAQASPCAIVPNSEDAASWRLQTLALPEGYKGSVVWEGPADVVELKWIDKL